MPPWRLAWLMLLLPYAQAKVDAKAPLTAKALLEQVDLIRGAVIICYPQGLPDWDFVRQCLEGTEELAGTSVGWAACRHTHGRGVQPAVACSGVTPGGRPVCLHAVATSQCVHPPPMHCSLEARTWTQRQAHCGLPASSCCQRSCSLTTWAAMIARAQWSSCRKRARGRLHASL